MEIKEPDFIAILKYKSAEEGGRKTPAGTGYRPAIKFSFSDKLTSGQQIFIDKDKVYPGETVTAKITMVSAHLFEKTLNKGTLFDFREGNIIIGTGEIIEIINQKLKKCYQIKEPNELIDYLKEQGRDAFHDWDYQLQTNYGFVHKLENGQVAFFNNHYNQKAILFETEKCFDDVIKADRFPIDNPEKEMFDIEIDRIKAFHLQADHYREHLNKVLKFDFPVITKEAAQAYLKKVIGRFIKKVTTATDVIALISVIGELVKQETNGKWFLEKRYGTYNPVYEPNILTSSGNVYLMSSRIIGKIKWRTSKLEDIFIDVHSTLTEPIKWAKYSKNKDNLIMLE